MTEKQVSGAGLRFLTLWFLVLFVLKVGVVDNDVQSWSWWWVYAPLWGGPAVLVAAFVLHLLLSALIDVLELSLPSTRKQRKARKAEKKRRLLMEEQRKKARLS